MNPKINTALDFENEGKIINLPDGVNPQDAATVAQVNVLGGYFTKVLSGFSEIILLTEHHLSIIRGLRVCKPTGEVVEVAESYSGTTVQIDSNVLLDNHVLIIY